MWKRHMGEKWLPFTLQRCGRKRKMKNSWRSVGIPDECKQAKCNEKNSEFRADSTLLRIHFGSHIDYHRIKNRVFSRILFPIVKLVLEVLMVPFHMQWMGRKPEAMVDWSLIIQDISNQSTQIDLSTFN